MRVENCTIRVNKHSSATEVFISNNAGINTSFYLPPDADVDPTQPLEFIPAPPPPSEENKGENG
jgi:hypothetical protein